MDKIIHTEMNFFMYLLQIGKPFKFTGTMQKLIDRQELRNEIEGLYRYMHRN
jgi:hypothetical protein